MNIGLFLLAYHWDYARIEWYICIKSKLIFENFLVFSFIFFLAHCKNWNIFFIAYLNKQQFLNTSICLSVLVALDATVHHSDNQLKAATISSKCSRNNWPSKAPSLYLAISESSITSDCLSFTRGGCFADHSIQERI